jgi:hypothetical protein
MGRDDATSRTPRMIRHPRACVQCVVKPRPTVTAPHRTTRDGSHTDGPSFRITILAGNWKMMYGMKKIMVRIEYRSPMESPRSSSIPAMRA